MLKINLLGKQKQKAAPKPAEKPAQSKFSVSPTILVVFAIAVIGFVIIQWGIPFYIDMQNKNVAVPVKPKPKVVKDTTVAKQPEKVPEVQQEQPKEPETRPQPIKYNTASTKNLIEAVGKMENVTTAGNYYLISAGDNGLLLEIQYGSSAERESVKKSLKSKFSNISFIFDNISENSRLLALGKGAGSIFPAGDVDATKFFSEKELKADIRALAKNNGVLLKEWIPSRAIEKDTYKAIPVSVKVNGTGANIKGFLDALSQKAYNIYTHKISLAYYPTGGSTNTSTQLVILCDVIVP